MKTIFAILLTAFIATGAIFAGLNQHHILLGYGIAFIAVFLLFRFLLKSRL